jgi:outer membrane protein assembly factor BamA
LVSLEDRFPIFSREMLDAGLAFFGDLGRVWGQDVPYGVDSGWRSSVGAGLRLNIPGGALRTVRADFTLPLSGDRDVHGIYFRFYTELGGLLQTPKRPGQVERSRWSGPDTNVTGSRPSG